MKIGIFTNLHKDKDLAVTKSLVAAFSARGATVVPDGELAAVLGENTCFSLGGDPGVDLMLSVGGDGTILRVAKACAVYGVPVVGVNLGYTGFLTEVEPSCAEELAETFFSGRYAVEERALMEVTAGGKRYLALNDAVIVRDTASRMPEIELAVNGEFVDKYHSDGFIVSTPTGSTAYSLSAGGPIVSPTVSAFVLTALNSHSLHSRPIVVSDADVIELRVPGKSRVDLVVDGEACGALAAGGTVRVSRSDCKVPFVRLSRGGFFSKLLKKLNKWSTTEKENGEL